MSKRRRQSNRKDAAFEVPYRPIAENLRTCREAIGLSRAELAKRSDVSFSTIRSIEEGRVTDPLIDTVVYLARALGITMGQLCGTELLDQRQAPATNGLNRREPERGAP